jgi:nucleoside-diphosphate-sugar epimerase
MAATVIIGSESPGSGNELEVFMRIFVTGASGWIGSAVVPELISAGHQVIGLARSDSSALTLESTGVEVARGSLDDLDLLRDVARASDGVIHLAFKHDEAFSGDFQGAADADRRVVEAFGEALAGSERPLLIASGTLGLAPGRVAIEDDGREPAMAGKLVSGGPETRLGTAQFTISLTAEKLRPCVVRLPPTCHGEGDGGFMAILVGIARATGVSGYLGDGSSRWPAAHRLDVAHLFKLALEGAPPGSILHAVAEEGVTIGQIAAAIGRNLDLPVAAIAADQAAAHFGFLAGFLGLDSPASSERTRALLEWQPTHPTLIEDLDQGHYFSKGATK